MVPTIIAFFGPKYWTMRGPNTANNVNDKYNVNKNAFPKDGSTVVAKLCVVFHAANIKKNAIPNIFKLF